MIEFVFWTIVAGIAGLAAGLYILAVLVEWLKIRSERRRREAFDFLRLGSDAPHIRPMGVPDLRIDVDVTSPPPLARMTLVRDNADDVVRETLVQEGGFQLREIVSPEDWGDKD